MFSPSQLPPQIQKEAYGSTRSGFAPTDFGTHYLNSGNDDSSVAENRYYLSKENLAWAVYNPSRICVACRKQENTMVYTGSGHGLPPGQGKRLYQSQQRRISYWKI